MIPSTRLLCKPVFVSLVSVADIRANDDRIAVGNSIASLWPCLDKSSRLDRMQLCKCFKFVWNTSTPRCAAVTKVSPLSSLLSIIVGKVVLATKVRLPQQDAIVLTPLCCPYSMAAITTNLAFANFNATASLNSFCCSFVDPLLRFEVVLDLYPCKDINTESPTLCNTITNTLVMWD